MLESPAALHRSRLYRLVARLVIVSLLLQALLPVPGPGTPVAQAGNGDPPLPVVVLDDPPPPATPEPPYEPPGVTLLPPGARVVPVAGPPDPPPSTPPAAPPPPVPVSFTLSTTPSAAPGDLLTLTLTITNPEATTLRNLELRAFVPEVARFAGGPPWQADPPRRLISTTIPLVGHRATVSRQFRLRLIGVPAGNRLQPEVTLALAGVGESTARATVAVDNPVTVGTFGIGGGELRSGDGRLRLAFPPGSLAAATRVEQRWRYAGELWPERPYRLLLLQLDAFDVATGAAVHTFGTPLSLTLRVDDLLAGAPAQRVYVRAWNAETPAWEVVAGPVTPDAVNGTIQVALTHFSEFEVLGEDSMEAGERHGWRLLFNDATAGLFNGSVSYSYPIDVPPGRHGLQPQLALTYNSDRVNGVLETVQSDWAGLGWSLDAVEITRKMGYGADGLGEGVWDGYALRCSHEGDLCLSNEYTLLFQGTSHRLIPEPNTNRYHTADESFLTITRECTGAREGPCSEMTNEPGHHPGQGTELWYDYWVVTTQDGTRYRLGSQWYSQQRASNVCIYYSPPDPLHRCGTEQFEDLVGPAVYRWRLDQATDVYGNQLRYEYVETQANQQGYGLEGELYGWDRESYLSRILYTPRDDPAVPWGYAVEFVLRCRTGAPNCAPGDYEPDAISDAPAQDYGGNREVLWFERKVLSAIRVLQMTSASEGAVIREYLLRYYSTAGNELPSRVLASVTPYGLGGCMPDEAWQCTTANPQRLPPLELSYEVHNNQGNQEPGLGCETREEFPYGRLDYIHNGYGGVIALDYAAPEFDPQWGHNCFSYLYNWRVKQKSVTDNVSAALVTSYTYNWPCYAGAMSTCEGLHGDGQRLVGYGQVQVHQYSGSPAGLLLGRSEHRFFPDSADWDGSHHDFGQRLYALVGREKLVRQLGASGVTLAEVETVYGSTPILERHDPNLKDVLFVHADEVIQRQYDTGGALQVQTRSATTYRTDIGKPSEQYTYGQTRLLANGGFEGASTEEFGLHVPEGWSSFHNLGVGTMGLAPVMTPAARVVGMAALAITHTAEGPCQCGVLQTLTAEQGIVAGTPYVVRARVRTASGAPTFRIWLSDGPNHSPRNEVVPSLDWQLFTQTFTPQATAALTVHLSLESGVGSVYVDDVWYERLDETGDEQTQKTWYTSPVTTGVEGLPMAVRVYTGTEVLADGQEAALTTYYYDNASGLGEVTLGALTAESRNHIIAQNWSLPQYRYTTRFGYDAYGNQTVVTDTRGYTSTTSFDPIYHSYPMTFTNALAQQSFLRYDFGLGKVITAVKAYDAMGRGGVETWLKYDAFGRLTHVVDDANNPSVAERDTLELPTLQYVYSDTYQTGLIRGPRIETIWREQSGTEQVKRQFEFYTGRGLLMQTRSEWGQDASPVQAVVNVTYDALGRATTSYTPVSEWYNTDYTQPITTVAKTQTQYDLLGRTVVVTGTDGLTTTTAYHGLQTAVVDANRHQKVSVVDTRGQLVTVKEYQAEYPQADFDAQPYATTHYEYNVLGNLTRVTDDQANVTTMSYNAIGQKLGMDDPDMADWEYRYDAAGNLISQRDAKLHYTCFYYDPLSRLKGKVFNGGSTCSETDPGYGGYSEAYYYDQPGHGYGLGQRTTMSNTNAIVAWTYDRRGRVTAETRSVTGLGVYTTRMGYDTANRVVTTTYPTGETLTNTYTAAWQPAQLLSSWLPLPYNLYGEASFNVRGQMTTYNHYNNLHTDYTYNETGATPSFRLAELKLQQFDTGAQYLTFQYQYDHVGNLTRLTEATNAGQRQCFVYDALDRLTSAFTGSDDCTAYSSRGSAPYNHSGDNDYRYDELGSITQLAGRVYDYEGSGHAHAVRYAYNAGADGRFDAFTTAPADAWSISACPACSLSYDDGGERVARHGGLSSATTAYRALTPTLQVGDALQVEFKVDQGQAQADASLQLADEYGNNVFGLTATPNQALRVQYKLGGGAAVYAPLSPALAVQAHAWYVLRLEPGNGTRPARLSVWPRANPALRAYYEMTSSVWNSVTGWRFRSFANTQASNQTILSLDSYFELQGAGASVWSYLYDANGNMTSRIEAGTAYSQTWDAQNRLVQVVYGPITQTLANATYTFGYDADGGRVLQVAPGGYRTAYSGAYEETITPTAVYAQSFNGSGGSWTTSGGTWAWDKPAGLRKQTSTAPGESASVVNPAVTWGEITATARVRLDAGTNALAGLVVRRHTSNAPAYFVGIRNSDSAWYCGIYEKSGSTWTNRTPGLTNCKYATGGWHTLLVRAAGGRIEMHVDGVLITTWADATPLPAQGFGLMTLDGAASFDDIKVYGLATRSYYLFGAARVGERTTTHGQAAGSSTGAGGGTRYALHSDHLGSVSLATDAGGMTVTLSLARYFPFGAERGAAATGSPTDFGYATGRGSALGLTQLGARWLATKLARWSSADTLVPSAANPQSLNRYSYVNSSPLAYIDPTGHCRYVAGAFVYDENCSVEEFASLKWADRLAWLDQFVRLNGLDDWFADIRGAITLLSTDVDFKSLASWGAQTDAGVLQAIQDGWRIFKGRDPIGRLADDGIVGPAHIHGGAIWAKFFRSNEQYKRNLHAGAASPADLDALIDVRLKAEQAGVDYAVRITRPLHDGADAHTQIKIELFVRSANFYRQTLAPGLRSAGSSHPVTDPRTSWDTLSALSVAIDPMAWFLWGQAQSAEQPGRRLP